MPSSVELETLYDAHAQAIFGFVLNLTRDEADTRDVVQELFLKLARHPELLPGVREPRAFLLRLAHNLSIDALRRHDARRRNQEQFSAERVEVFAPGSNPDEQACREALASALGELPTGQRAVVHLKLWEEMTFEEIAGTLGIPLNTAASRYRYGIDKLRERLRPLYEELK